MKRLIPIVLLTFLLSACGGWVIQPGPTPFLPATFTPSIFSPTPAVIGVTSASSTPVLPTATATSTGLPPITPTFTFTPTNTLIVTPTLTNSPTGPSIAIILLGCNTSVDVLHGLGEVTNAFVTLRNTGGVPLTNLKATLFALDEGREHPDKTVELVSLPVASEVTIKLTVDSTYRQDTPIQVEVSSDQGIFPREGSASCTDIGLFAPNPGTLSTPVPSVP